MFLAWLLQKSVTHKDNHDINIKVVCAACSDKTGIEEFAVARRGRACNGLMKTGQRSTGGAFVTRNALPRSLSTKCLSGFLLQNC